MEINWQPIRHKLSSLKTKGVDVTADIKGVLANLDKVMASSVDNLVKENYLNVISSYVDTVLANKRSNDKGESFLKRYTRIPYDKGLELLYLIVYDPSIEESYVSLIIDPLKDCMALHAINKIPIEFLMMIAIGIDDLNNNITQYHQFRNLFKSGNITDEERKASDENNDARITILNRIATVADTFVDLRLHKII